MTSSPMVPQVAGQVSSGSWWFRSSEGRTIVWQPPNPALCIWLAAVLLGQFELSATHATTVEGVRRGALLVWALDEIVRGANPFRRLLGAAVLASQIGSFVLG